MDTSKEAPETDPVRLAAENERLRAALRDAAEAQCPRAGYLGMWDCERQFQQREYWCGACRARAALAPSADDSQGGGSV